MNIKENFTHRTTTNLECSLSVASMAIFAINMKPLEIRVVTSQNTPQGTTANDCLSSSMPFVAVFAKNQKDVKTRIEMGVIVHAEKNYQ